MVVVTCISEITIQIPAYLRQSPIRVIAVPRVDRPTTIRHLPGRAKVILRVVVARASDPFSLRIETLCDGVATIPFLGRLCVSGNPHELLRDRHAAVVFLHDLDALAQAVVGEFGPVRAAGYCSQAVPGLPFVRLRTITR